MAWRSIQVSVSDSDREALESWRRAGSAEYRLVLRAKIILASARGETTANIARCFHVSPQTVSKWRKRFTEQGLAGLSDAPRSGKPATYDTETERRVLAKLDEPPPQGYASWNGRLLAGTLGDVSDDQVWRILRRHRIDLERRHSWCVSTDPEFTAKAADVVGLYIAPPENAVVLCVDEKPHIQALERAQGWLRLPNGKAITGFLHEYERHGTTTLFAALDVATGQAKTGHYNRRRRREFLDFMNEVVAGYDSSLELHVILDNLNTHKPKNDRWLARHKNVHFHYTPTHASWLNQIKIWKSVV